MNATEGRSSATPSRKRISVVTGANSGIGRAAALELARRGDRVFGTVRSHDRAGKLERLASESGVQVELVELDVADDSSVWAGFGQIFDATDGVIDVLVNNAGIGRNLTVEDCPTETMLELTNVNLCGPLRCIQAALPSMRRRRTGVIVNVTSIVGRFAALAQAPYVASKHALEGLSEELAQEVAPFGVRVVIVEPGVTRSSIFAKNKDLPDATGPYAAAYRRMMRFYAIAIAGATDARVIADAIADSAHDDSTPLRVAVGWGAQELLPARAAMTDEEWVQLGMPVDDDEYYRQFGAAFGIDLATSPTRQA